ncbi:hypothetical protein N9L47_08915 [Rhodobacteraceae bacterium]|nr:hypothetical protein [Paracoccaceae bacterium]
MSDPLIRIEDASPMGMVTLRAELNDGKAASALAFSGLEIPAPHQVTGTPEKGVLWMSPDELMIMTLPDASDAMVATLNEAFEGTHSLAVNVSDARSAFRLKGRDALVREVLAKLTPADMRPASLPVGRLRRTRLAQVPAAFWFTGDGEAMLICFRSVGGYVFDLLSKVAEEGTEVGYF